MILDEARLMANVNARAQRLFEDGYRGRWVGPSLLAVRNGRGGVYRVEVAAGTCDCPFFLRGGHPCKHLLGWERLLAEQRARMRRLGLMLAALLRVREDLDDGSPVLDAAEPAGGGTDDAG